MEATAIHLEAANLDLETAKERQQAAQAALEEANVAVKLHEAGAELAKHHAALAKLLQEHRDAAGQQDSVHCPACWSRTAALASAEAAGLAAAAARAELAAAGRRAAAAAEALREARLAAGRARDGVLARREDVRKAERELRALRDEHRACEALRAGQSPPAATMSFSNDGSPQGRRAKKLWDESEQEFVDQLPAAPRLRSLSLDLHHSVFKRKISKAVLVAISHAPADIAELRLSFSPAPAIKTAVFALLARVRDHVRHLVVERVVEEFSCEGTFGAGWAVGMDDGEVRTFWRLVEESGAAKLTLGCQGQDSWLVRKGPFHFRKGFPRHVTELDVGAFPGGADTMLMRLLQAYGPALRGLRLPERLAAAEHPAALRAAAKQCALLEELAVGWGPGLHQLAACRELRALRLEGGRPADADVRSLRTLAKQAAFVDRLERLTIASKLGSSDGPSAAALRAVTDFKRLRFLSLPNFDAFLSPKDGKGPRMKEVLAGLPLLEELELHAVGEVEELSHIEPSSLPSLKVLRVRPGEPMARDDARQWRQLVDGLRSPRLTVHDDSGDMPDSDGDAQEEEEEARRGASRRRRKRKHCDSEDDAAYGSSSPECVC